MERKNGVSLYTQVASILRKEIAGKKYKEGDSIGTHEDLCERFGVSIITVRKALQLLADEDFIEIKQGKGTFVKSVKIDALGSSDLNSIGSAITAYSLDFEQTLVELKLIDTPDWFETEIKKAFGRRCLYFRRIATVEGSNILVHNTYVHEKYNGLVSFEDLEKYSMYDLFRDRFGVKPDKAIQTLSVVDADGSILEILDITKGVHVVALQRKSYDTDGNLIEYMEDFADARSAKITTTLDISK